MHASLVFAARGFAAAVIFIAWLASSGCAALHNRSLDQTLRPSNKRDWRTELAVLPTAKIQQDRVDIDNIRNCTWISEEDVVVDYYDKTFERENLLGVDFIVVPFKDAPSLAHTMLSFDFGDHGQVAISVEARLEKGETYSPVGGSLRQFELMYVVGDERDLIRLRTKVRDVEMYLYRTNATPEQSWELLVDMLERTNKLAKRPEFYDSLANNCTTNLANHVNKIRPNRVPLGDMRILLPGYADRLAYDLGLIDRSRPFEELKQQAQINYLARVYDSDSSFSEKIRRR